LAEDDSLAAPAADLLAADLLAADLLAARMHAQDQPAAGLPGLMILGILQDPVAVRRLVRRRPPVAER